MCLDIFKWKSYASENKVIEIFRREVQTTLLLVIQKKILKPKKNTQTNLKITLMKVHIYILGFIFFL